MLQISLPEVTLTSRHLPDKLEIKNRLSAEETDVFDADAIFFLKGFFRNEGLTLDSVILRI